MSDLTTGETETVLKDALRHAFEGRQSHVLWAQHLEAHGNGASACERCTPEVVETAGDAAEHREWVRKYDTIIEALQINSTPLMLHAIAAISDEESYKSRRRAVQHALRYRASIHALEAILEQAREALYNHGYGPGLCRCEDCSALAAADAPPANSTGTPHNTTHVELDAAADAREGETAL